MVNVVYVFKLDFVVFEECVYTIIGVNDQISFSICSSLFFGPLNISIWFVIFSFLFTLVISTDKFDLNVTVLVSSEASHHFVSIMMNIVNSISINSSPCCKDLASLRPLRLILLILGEKLPHVINANDANQIDLKCIFFVYFLVLSELYQLINGLHLLV